MISNRIGLLLAAAIVAGSGAAIAAAPAKDQNAIVDKAGKMRVPSDYQATYQYLGTWAVAADADKGSKEMHVVFASPGAAAAHQKSGNFADGTVLVKEVYEAATGGMTTGTVSHSSKLKGWFVMVRDSKDSYKGNPLWGDGWGWSWFDAADPIHTTTSNYLSECQGCHVPARTTEWIYKKGYPPLAK